MTVSWVQQMKLEQAPMIQDKELDIIDHYCVNSNRNTALCLKPCGCFMFV